MLDDFFIVQKAPATVRVTEHISTVYTNTDTHTHTHTHSPDSPHLASLSPHSRIRPPHLRVQRRPAVQRPEQHHLLHGAELRGAPGVRADLRAVHGGGGLAALHCAHGHGGHEALPVSAGAPLCHGECHTAHRTSTGR